MQRSRKLTEEINTMFDKKLISRAERIIEDPNDSILYEEACNLAVSQNNAVDLIMCANKIREKYKKNKVFTCSIINAKSGRCSEDCAFCAQSVHHKTGIGSYPLLDKEKIVNNSISIEKKGATKYSMVTSGHSLSSKEIYSIGNTAEEINKKTDLSVCASLGQLTEPMALKLKEKGVTTYHHNLETAESYFNQICTTHNYNEDIYTVKTAKSAGLEICSGGILGLGESWAQRVELAFTLKKLDVDSIPVNFLNPIPGTRMENRPLLPPMEALKSIAIFRFINPDKDITICGGRGKTLGDFQSWVFMAGANGIIIGNYLTTKGRSVEMDMDMIRQFNFDCA